MGPGDTDVGYSGGPVIPILWAVVAVLGAIWLGAMLTVLLHHAMQHRRERAARLAGVQAFLDKAEPPMGLHIEARSDADAADKIARGLW